MWIKLRFKKKISGCGLYTGALNRPKITVFKVGHCFKVVAFHLDGFCEAIRLNRFSK